MLYLELRPDRGKLEGMTEKISGALTPDTQGIAEWTAGGPLRSGLKLTHEGRTGDPGANSLHLPSAYEASGHAWAIKNDCDNQITIGGYGTVEPHSSLVLESDGKRWNRRGVTMEG